MPHDRIRALTAPALNRRIDEQTGQDLRRFSGAGAGEIGRRIRELDREWDFERILEFDSAAQGLIGLGLGVTRNRAWLLVPGAVAGMMFVHSVAGSYPMLPILRLIGFRSRDEIDREKYALEAMQAPAAPPRPAGKPAPVRLRELDREWDMNRVFQANAAVGIAAGLALGAAVDRRWFALPAAVLSFVMLHSIGGWSPPVSLFRRLGVRTRQEINRERHALGGFEET